MNLVRTDLFKKDFLNLPVRIRRQTEKALRLLVADLSHPSLHI